jgi:hypothetical protein
MCLRDIELTLANPHRLYEQSKAEVIRVANDNDRYGQQQSVTSDQGSVENDTIDQLMSEVATGSLGGWCLGNL